jgi:membrane fusion protein, multidrug efflux system
MLAGAGAGFLFSQRSGPTKSGRGTPAPGGVPVSVDFVKRGNMPVYLSAIGTVTPVYTVTVTSRVAGQLMDVYYKEGQIVRKGDLLALIDPRPYQAAVVQGKGQLARDQALLANARIDLDRYALALQKKAIPEQEYATQQATVSQDQGTVELDQGNLEAAQINLDYTQITSPIDGRVGLRLVDPGNIVAANGTTGLLTIAQLQPITVIFVIAEDYISDIVHAMHAGQTLRVDALDREDQHEIAQGTLLTLDNQIDTTTGTVRVRANFPNKNNELFPNEFVNARLFLKTLRGVSIVPTAAIQRNGDQAFVYVVNRAASTVQLQNINVTATSGNLAAATGLKPGDTLVTDGFDQLDNGVKVSIKAATTPSSSTTQTAPGQLAQPATPETANPPSNTGNTKLPPSTRK